MGTGNIDTEITESIQGCTARPECFSNNIDLYKLSDYFCRHGELVENNPSFGQNNIIWVHCYIENGLLNMI